MENGFSSSSSSLLAFECVCLCLSLKSGIRTVPGGWMEDNKLETLLPVKKSG